jgi:O-antigen/teichoic acid export membrane protein
MEISKVKIWVTRSSIISIAPAVEFASRFSRTVILSRSLATDEFGIAVAITVMLGIASLVTDVAIDKFAVIEADESGREALAAAHMLSLVRGGVLSLILAASAPLTAALFGVGDSADSFALAALAPFISSFVHLGIKQVQRHYDYAPETWCLLFSNGTAICALLIAVAIFHDHRAIVVSVLVEAAAYVLASHLMARTPYRLKANKELVRRALSFGIPLMLNGIGLALMAQFDRALVGHWFGVDMLAKYSVVLSVSVVPISLVLRIFGTMSLSFILSNVRNRVIAPNQYGFLVSLFAVLALIYSLFVVLTLDWGTPLIFGRSFNVNLSMHILVTVIAFLRLQRGGAPTNLFLATGRTKELALLNLSAAAGLILAWTFLLWSPRFEMLLLGLAVGDVLSFLLLLLASATVVSLNKKYLIVNLSVAFAILAVILGTLTLNPDVNVMARLTIFGVGIIGVAVQIAVGLWSDRALSARAGDTSLRVD